MLFPMLRAKDMGTRRTDSARSSRSSNVGRVNGVSRPARSLSHRHRRRVAVLPLRARRAAEPAARPPSTSVDDEQITIERRLLGAPESAGPGVGFDSRSASTARAGVDASNAADTISNASPPRASSWLHAERFGLGV